MDLEVISQAIQINNEEKVETVSEYSKCIQCSKIVTDIRTRICHSCNQNEKDVKIQRGFFIGGWAVGSLLSSVAFKLSAASVFSFGMTGAIFTFQVVKLLTNS